MVQDIHNFIKSCQTNTAKDEHKWLALILYKAYLMGKTEVKQETAEIVDAAVNALQGVQK
jgi:hypothetical protein